MDLFEIARNTQIKSKAPLAERLKPVSMEEFIGQEHILGKGKLLRRAIEADRIQSIILYGPPGTGKTSLAKVIANTTRSEFVQVNAVTSGVKELREVIETAKNALGMYHKRTILFIDEIHRFNKAQQDGLLPSVEDGTVILIGATTENPYFEVNGALMSRSMIFQLKTLNEDDIVRILKRAIADAEKGLGGLNIAISDNDLRFLASYAGGDARKALNALELAALTTAAGTDGRCSIDSDVLEDCLQKKPLRYDKGGDYHYDVASAFIKSIRGSDPDAALHYMARMLASGEPPEFIARRMIISASEDIGNAEPMGLVMANAAFDAVHKVGMPEARIILAQACTFLALSPKSNAAYMGINNALRDLEEKDCGSVPAHLKDSSYSGAAKLGNGTGYLYPHNYPGHWVNQQYLPDELVDVHYYIPTDQGKEIRLKQRYQCFTK